MRSGITGLPSIDILKSEFVFGILLENERLIIAKLIVDMALTYTFVKLL